MATNETGPPGGGSWGEYVSWDTPKGQVALGLVRAALTAEGLDDEIVPDMRGRNAFRRAARRLTELQQRKLVRFVSEDATQVVYQFTGEEVVGEALSYSTLDTLRLSKATGEVRSDDPDRQVLVNRMMDHERGHRGGRDISAAVDRLFRSKGDLFRVREAGGLYLVPAADADFVARIGRFLAAVGGRLHRLPAASGDPAYDQTAHRAVADGLDGLIDQFLDKVQEFTDETGPRAVGRAEADLADLAHKLRCYDVHLEALGDRRAEIQSALAHAEGVFRDRLVAADTPPPAGLEAAAA